MNKIIAIILIALIILALSDDIIETFRGGGRHHGGRHRHHGGGGRRHGGGRRRYWGGGYGRRGWGWGPRYAWFGGWPTCKNGCTAIGNGRWGCQYPGYGVNDCMFADDCNWCSGLW